MLKYFLKSLFFALLYAFLIVGIKAQKTELKIQVLDSIPKHQQHILLYKKVHDSKKSAFQEIELFSDKLARIGLINKYKTTIVSDTLIQSNISIEEKIDSVRVYYPNNILPNSFLKQLNIKFEPLFFTASISEIENILNTIVNYFELNGNSFTEVSLTKFNLQNSILTTSLNIKTSEQRTVDKIIIDGYPDFPKKIIKQVFKLKPTTTFNIKTLNLLSSKLASLNYASQIKPPEVLFLKDSTIIYMYAKKKSQNKFDGIIGFSNDENSNKLNFTGNLNIELSNIFNKGEEFEINWKSNSNDNKTFNIRFFTPYIYNTKFSPTFQFSIIRQDSSYVNVNSSLNLNYSINQKHSVNGKYKSESSNILSQDYSSTTAEFKKKWAGISYSYTTKIKSENPFNLEIGYLIGNRNSDSQNTQQTNFALSSNYLFNLNSRNFISFKHQTELLFSDTVFENELYKIGGATSIRGFDELAISASKYSITNFEYHYKLNEFSNVYSISDIGYMENDLLKMNSNLYSLGIGYVFNTNKSSTNLSYALGKTSDLPFQFNNSKVHLKISYYF